MLKRVFLITMALLLATAVSLSAGDKKEKFAKLRAELGLSDAQVTQLQKQFDELGPMGQDMERRAKALTDEIRELENSANPDQQALSAKRSEREALTKEWHEKVMAIYRSVLTDEQFAKFDQMHSRHEKEDHEQKEKEHRDRMI